MKALNYHKLIKCTFVFVYIKATSRLFVISMHVSSMCHLSNIYILINSDIIIIANYVGKMKLDVAPTHLFII